MSVDQYIADMFAAYSGSIPCDLEAVGRSLDAAERMRFSHGLMTRKSRKSGSSNTAFLRDASPKLRSPLQLRKTPSAARRFAGTEDAVCLWMGPLRITDRQAALVFAPGVATPQTTATPWDSGGLRGCVGQHLDPKARQALTQARSFPEPGFRKALATAMFLRHGTPENYLRGQIVKLVDPDQICNPDDMASFTYEVRVPRALDVHSQHLVFAAAHRDVLDDGLNSLRTWCVEKKVPFVVVGGEDSVQEVVLNFFVRSLP